MLLFSCSTEKCINFLLFNLFSLICATKLKTGASFAVLGIHKMVGVGVRRTAGRKPGARRGEEEIAGVHGPGPLGHCISSAYCEPRGYHPRQIAA